MLELLDDRLLIKPTYESDGANNPFLSSPSLSSKLPSSSTLTLTSIRAGCHDRTREASVNPDPLCLGPRLLLFTSARPSIATSIERYVSPHPKSPHLSIPAAHSPAAHEVCGSHQLWRSVSPRDGPFDNPLSMSKNPFFPSAPNEIRASYTGRLRGGAKNRLLAEHGSADVLPLIRAFIMNVLWVPGEMHLFRLTYNRYALVHLSLSVCVCVCACTVCMGVTSVFTPALVCFLESTIDVNMRNLLTELHWDISQSERS